MSIFSGEAVPSRVIGVLRTLNAAEGKSLTLERLRMLMHPRSVWSKAELEKETPNSMVEENLGVCVDLGLVTEPREDGCYVLADTSAVNLDYEDCLKELGRRLLGGKGVAEPGGVNLYDQLSWMLAWYLEQPPERWPPGADKLEQLVGDWEERGFKKVLQAPHFDQFRHWGEALGLLSLLQLKGPGDRTATEVLLVNPAPFLRRHLSDFMKANEPMLVDDWFRALAERFRIFETGPIRRQVSDRDDHVISPALDLALRQLEDEGLLALQGITDGKEYLLKLDGTRPLTHLTYLPRKAG